MKAIYKAISILIVFIVTNYLYAQPGRSPHINNSIKLQPRTNAILKATTNVNAKIHANSNSVFGSGNTHLNLNKKEQGQKKEIKNVVETKKNSKIKKQKK